MPRTWYQKGELISVCSGGDGGKGGMGTKQTNQPTNQKTVDR